MKVKVNPKVRENQAQFWHAFAYLACLGKRTLGDFHIAKLVDPPTDEQVAAIKAEAQGVARG